MYAALHGKSTLGIPRSVAAKFVGEKAHNEPEGRDMSRFDWSKIRDGLRALFKFVDEEEREPEHAEDDQERDEKGQFKAVTGNVGGQRHIETKPGSGKYVPLGKISVHKYEEGAEPHLHNIVHHTDNEKQADKHAARLWEKTGVPHITRHTQYLRRPSGSKDSALDEGPKGRAASVIFIEPTGYVLFAKRGPNEENWPDTWSLPGGRADGDEAPAPAACAAREATEELGRDCAADELIEVETKRTEHGWEHTTFACPVDGKFKPKLNHEHSAFVWAPWDDPPRPLHPGVAATLEDLGSQLDDGDFGEDEKDEDATFKKLEEELGDDAALTTEKTGMIRTGAGLGELLPYTTKVLGEAGMLKGAAAHPKDTENVISGAKLGRPRMASAEKHSGAADIGGYPVKVQAQDGTWRYSRPLLETAARKARARGRGDIARRAEAILASDQTTYGEEKFIEPPPKPAVPPQPAPSGEDEEEKFAADSTLVLAMDWCASVGIKRVPLTVILAFDRDSVRRRDIDGRLHVEESNLTRATVSPYRGSEIPDWKKHGLDADRIYYLLRDPEELAKPETVASFNRIPILEEHRPISSDDHPHSIVIGTTGDRAVWDPPFIKNSLSVWTKGAIDAIESNKKKDLSAGYRYEFVPDTGEYKGKRYQGRMVNIRANHMASVVEGRVPGAFVGDSALRRRS